MNDFQSEVPAYQRDAIEWLEGYKRTEPLQDMLRRLRFSEREVSEYRRKWEQWLKPKKQTQLKIARGIY